MIFMKIVKKVRGKHPELVEMEKDDVISIFDSGMDRRKLFKSYYLVDKYQIEKTEKTFNTSILFPHTTMVHYHNDVYIIKKGLFGIKSITEDEFNELKKLFRYDFDRVREDRNRKPIVNPKLVGCLASKSNNGY